MVVGASLAIIVAVVLGVVLGRHDDISSEKKDEQENQDSDTTEVENNVKEEKNEEEEIDYKYRDKMISDSLYVKKIENLPDDFIFGMDLSSIIAEENSGVKFYNFQNEEKDIFETLRYVGVNYIRIRIWNDSYDSEGHGYGGGNKDMNKAIEIGKRVTKYGMKVLASFHYSDFYADPGSQNVPKAWRGLTLEQKVKKAEEYTIESMTRFKNEGVDVGMVALGNEINDFFCGETDWVNIVKILNARSKATKQVLPNTLVSVHFTNPEREGSMMYFAKSLNDNNLDYDVFSVSYYNVWDGDISCLNQLNEVAETYNKKYL
jgi:arabinogalactan endo-1,4-beta-galactosidase